MCFGGVAVAVGVTMVVLVSALSLRRSLPVSRCLGSTKAYSPFRSSLSSALLHFCARRHILLILLGLAHVVVVVSSPLSRPRRRGRPSIPTRTANAAAGQVPACAPPARALRRRCSYASPRLGLCGLSLGLVSGVVLRAEAAFSSCLCLASFLPIDRLTPDFAHPYPPPLPIPTTSLPPPPPLLPLPFPPLPPPSAPFPCPRLHARQGELR